MAPERLAKVVELLLCRQPLALRLELEQVFDVELLAHGDRDLREQVELDRYLGTWYEIASFPMRVQQGCEGTTATYSLAEGGDEILVENRCYKEGSDGPVTEAIGRARVVNAETNAELEVSFFGPFWGDYWIIDLGADYEFAAVGHPGRDYLWVLSRTPTLEPGVYEGILQRLTDRGYEVTRLVETKQG